MTLRTSMAPEQVAGRLAKMVAVGPWYFERPPEPFKGSIQGTQFKVVRVPRTPVGRYPSSPPVIIVGNIVPAPEGTEVRVRLRLHALLAAFITMWFAAMSCLAVMLLWSGLSHGFGPYARGGRQFAGAGVGLAFMGGVMLVGYVLMSVAFWTEAKKASALLRQGLGFRGVEDPKRLVGSSRATP